MKRSILLGGLAAAAFSLSPVAYAQTRPAVTNPTSPVTSNPKSNANTPQCAQPAPGETHVNPANCSNLPATTPSTPKTIPAPKAKTKPAKTATDTKPAITPPPVLPTASNACPKTGAMASTPGNPQCDTNSGAHEGGPFGH